MEIDPEIYDNHYYVLLIQLTERADISTFFHDLDIRISMEDMDELKSTKQSGSWIELSFLPHVLREHAFALTKSEDQNEGRLRCLKNLGYVIMQCAAFGIHS